jgi:hypothetical protein
MGSKYAGLLESIEFSTCLIPTKESADMIIKSDKLKCAILAALADIELQKIWMQLYINQSQVIKL